LILGIAILMVVLFSTPVSAECAPAKRNITSSGYYQLDSDSDYQAVNIWIKSSDVTLDGMGHTISGASPDLNCGYEGIRVSPPSALIDSLNNVHIRDRKSVG